MDAQGRGRADDVDPADQWVLNPRTGEYELRLPGSAGHPSSRPRAPKAPAPRSAAPAGTGPAGAGPARPASGAAVPGARRRTAAPGRDLPPQRRRRAAPEEPPPGRRGRRPAKKAKKSRGRKILMWSGGTMAFVVLATGVGGYLYLKHLEGNVSTTDVGDAGARSFKKNEAFNILLIGTDRRIGKGNEGYGDKGSVGHADTTILLHVAKDRSNATALSIPRDLIV
ncbi:LytR family transcriptional regulator, partial [Streptomyces sp. SID8352]|nr:LytR family transcriptional regulator [Streptomyces sp. SID8352]